MKRFLLIILALSFVFSGFSQSKQKTTTYFLIRHAEKDRSNPENKNPHLNKNGFERAIKWSKIFKDVKIGSVYTTNYNRTTETASPTAISHRIKLHFYNPTKIDYKKFMVSTKGKIVLIVGHSNTIPNFVNALIGIKKYKQIAYTNNSNLYVVTLIGDKVSYFKLYVK